MIYKKIIFYLSITFFYALSSLAIENKILFTIDNELITSVDIYNQTIYVKSINQDFENLSKQDIFKISKKLLIKEKIKKIKLLENNVKLDISDEILVSFIKSVFYSKNINNLDEYKDFIKSLDLDYEIMKEKLIIDLLWNDMIFKNFANKIKINRDDLKKQILNNGKRKQTSYLLSEIMFVAVNKLEIDTKYKIIKESIERQGFKNTALIHSIADTANDGGKVGWINQNSLSQNINKNLSIIDKGQYSKPILTPGGFLILMIEDKKEIEQKINFEKELNTLIRMNTNRQLNQFSTMYFNRIKKDITINEF